MIDFRIVPICATLMCDKSVAKLKKVLEAMPLDKKLETQMDTQFNKEEFYGTGLSY